MLGWIVAFVVAVAAAAAWLNYKRRHTRRFPPPPREPERVSAGGGTRSAIATQTLLAAFRSDEMPIAEDSEREDQRKLRTALQLLADHVGAYEAVLWRPFEDNEGRLLPIAWSKGTEPPALSESERSLIEWSAAEAKPMSRGEEPAIRLLAVGVALGDLRGAVSVHFREDPTRGRDSLELWLGRHSRSIADLHDVLRNRADSASRNYKMRAMIRTATTLQASRDPMALEETFVQDSCAVTGAAWTILVRWDQAARVGVWARASEAAPEFGVRATARQGCLIGEVCLGGVPRVFSDARPLLASRDPVFDDLPLPSGIRSLMIIPVRRSDRESPVGALLCGHPERNRLRTSDAHAARDLGAIAAAALETAWAVRDETERARTDPLTGLSNRRHFDESFARMISETDRYGGASALVILDIDFFKKVNDTYGHEAGDAVLVAVGQALRDARRATDFVARLGGEELALLLPQTDEQGALEVAERLRQRIAEMRVATPAGEIGVTASFGVAMYAARSGSGGRLYERADRALYAAKHGGRNRVELAPADAPWTG